MPENGDKFVASEDDFAFLPGSPQTYEVDIRDLLNFAEAYHELSSAGQERLKLMLDLENDHAQIHGPLTPDEVDEIKDCMGGLHQEIDILIDKFEEDIEIDEFEEDIEDEDETEAQSGP